MQAEALVEAVRKVVRALRYGPRELVLATIGALLLGLPKLLPETPEVLKPVLVWIPWLGILVLILAAWRIWRKAVAPLPEGKPKPAAIKGPAPFGPQDAELFARLGRNEDLNRLRDWILDDQKPLVALMGESGVGKTSLLRAGLASHLKGDGIPVVYWEALPTDPEAGLLHAVRSAWGDPATVPADFQDLAKAVTTGRKVVVIDQAEQLSPERHGAIFDLLRQVVSANPPYADTWVIAFRREYLPAWRDFELSLPEPVQRRLETLSLRRFPPDAAERVVAVLAEEGGVPVAQKVVEALVESVTVEGRVAPADIGISLLVLSELSADGGEASTFSLDDFRERGGQAGLLTRYLEGLLDPLSEAERREVFKSLLSLIDLDKDQRLAEGRTLPQLEESARPASPARFEQALRFLASGKARVLEEVPEPPLRYRLVHERLIPAIRRLTGVLLAEAEQAGLALERAYRVWSRDRKPRYLLSGRELKQAARFREQLAWGDDADEKRKYLRLSLRQRNRLWLSAALILAVLGGGIHLYSEHRSEEATYRNLLESWGLPPDLLDRLDQIEELTLPGTVTRVDWLRKAHQLRSLSIEEGDLASLEGLPEGLRSLKVGVSTSRALPKSLISLQISSIAPVSLKNLPKGLLLLDVDTDWQNINQIPSSIKTLKLRLLNEAGPTKRLDLTRFEHLRSLSLSGSVKELLLPKKLRSLTLQGFHAESLVALPRSLQALNCEPCEPDLLRAWPMNGRHLSVRIEEPGDMAAISPSVTSLRVPGYLLPKQELPNLGILSIVIERGDPTSKLDSLPPSLRRLRINAREAFGFGSPSTLELRLPQGLTALWVSSNRKLRFADGLPRSLKKLVLYAPRFENVQQFPADLTSLTYVGPTLQSLPASLRHLSFGGSSVSPAAIVSLKDLQQLELSGEFSELPQGLDSLADLNIWKAEIGLRNLPSNLTSLTLRPNQWVLAGELHKLPPGLISITLGPGPVNTLTGMPESVVSLHFYSD